MYSENYAHPNLYSARANVERQGNLKKPCRKTKLMAKPEEGAVRICLDSLAGQNKRRIYLRIPFAPDVHGRRC